MKKNILTIAIVLGLCMTSFAGDGLKEMGGVFQRGKNVPENYNSSLFNSRNGGSREEVVLPALPNYGENSDQVSPLGSGVVVLMGLGAAYLVGKRRKEE